MKPIASETQSPSRGKILLGGGLLAGLAYWIFGKHGGGKDGSTSTDKDVSRLVFRVLDAGLALSSAPLATMTLDAAIKRVKDGGRSDVALVIPGPTTQKFVDAALAGFASNEIEVYK